MNILLKRLYQTSDCTIGSIYVNDVFHGFTLEDIHRSNKVHGKTRIPAGTYTLLFKKVLTGLTKKYRNKFKWFNWHIELMNVPNFKCVYIHIGNTSRDTQGCILVGKGHTHGSSSITNSTDSYINLYRLVSSELEMGNNVNLTIQDDVNTTQEELNILDMNNDGVIDMTDYALLQQELEL